MRLNSFVEKNSEILPQLQNKSSTLKISSTLKRCSSVKWRTSGNSNKQYEWKHLSKKNPIKKYIIIRRGV
jgi:hypothetical protein